MFEVVLNKNIAAMWQDHSVSCNTTNHRRKENLHHTKGAEVANLGSWPPGLGFFPKIKPFLPVLVRLIWTIGMPRNGRDKWSKTISKPMVIYKRDLHWCVHWSKREVRKPLQLLPSPGPPLIHSIIDGYVLIVDNYLSSFWTILTRLAIAIHC